MKPTLISGIQPSGKLHVGNYLGALKNFVALQNSGKYKCFFFIADLHSLTEPKTWKKPEEKRGQINEIILSYLAAGLDPEKSTIFLQSAVPAHSELAWILNTLAPLGEMQRMTQFKEKTEKEAANLGLLAYPTLMAADILLYDAGLVPVGNDQIQHLELTRTLVRKFNKRFGKTFTEPKPLLTRVPRLMNLQDPEKKMSKSEPEGCVFLDDSPKIMQEKIKRAVTDSDKKIVCDPVGKPAISNLILMFAEFSDIDIDKVEGMYAEKGYGDFKKDLGDVLVKTLAPFQEKKGELKRNMSDVLEKIQEGNEKASEYASKKMEEVKHRIGIELDPKK